MVSPLHLGCSDIASSSLVYSTNGVCGVIG
nr:MAG TPA: hypothetical protein [Crassvirales sp.]